MKALRVRKKPVEVEVMQFDGTQGSLLDLKKWSHNHVFEDNGIARVNTLEGHSYPLRSSDWVIRGVKGEYYPCEHSIFLTTYTFDLTDSPVALLAAERKRQIEQEGWSLSHDDEHDEGELAEAGVMYALAAKNQARGRTDLSEPAFWPWEKDAWKPSANPIRNLVKAGALILAEIERLQRKGETN